MHGDHLTFDENTETLDAYITYIRQVATFLGYKTSMVNRSLDLLI